MDLADQIKNVIIDDIKIRIYDECLPRIKQCLNELSIEEIWQRPNENSNSIGNLVLHLCGNIRQYVISGIGEEQDVRVRGIEFSERGPIPRSELIEKIDLLQKETKTVIENIESKDLIKEKMVQGFDMNVSSILIHVTEHLSYHTGQIAFYTKQLKNIDLKFYGDMNLDITN